MGDACASSVGARAAESNPRGPGIPISASPAQDGAFNPAPQLLTSASAPAASGDDGTGESLRARSENEDRARPTDTRRLPLADPRAPPSCYPVRHSSSWRGRRPARQFFCPSSRSLLWGSRACASCPLFLTPSTLKYHCSSCPFDAPSLRNDTSRSSACSTSPASQRDKLQDSGEESSAPSVVCVEDAALGGAPAAPTRADASGARLKITLSPDDEPCMSALKPNTDSDAERGEAQVATVAQLPSAELQSHREAASRAAFSSVSATQNNAGSEIVSPVGRSQGSLAPASASPAMPVEAGPSKSPVDPLGGRTVPAGPAASPSATAAPPSSRESAAGTSERLADADPAGLPPLNSAPPSDAGTRDASRRGDGAPSSVNCDACPCCLDICANEQCPECLALRSLPDVLDVTRDLQTPLCSLLSTESVESLLNASAPSSAFDFCQEIAQESAENLCFETSSGPTTPPRRVEFRRPASTPILVRGVSWSSPGSAASAGPRGWLSTKCLKIISREPAPEYTLCQVARHCRSGGCWLVAHDCIYDALPILSIHPGGSGCLLRKAQQMQDCSRDYDFHSRRGRQLWERLMVGRVKFCPGWDRRQREGNGDGAAQGGADAEMAEQFRIATGTSGMRRAVPRRLSSAELQDVPVNKDPSCELEESTSPTDESSTRNWCRVQ
ncbi:conserved hypothetical protein [Neospora caninum Liverpool]|uniref:Cytochrome b5 heme-binding domain-containing protein n=1 Tax=Neospora caninum (strain Liverpool) TaxID=572307 RepID=F0V9E4_NEOCL|nr:conserved hypothetical protein [Neospora caninum Liverpool]CBZ50369.1 conserved hypothetical protein [Neospora caninum Liverpool]CEL64976.1 TPA: hypothetical protein BN1204_008390 [Neospora caninum Liverpool]|eukprot:XP_003880403.1 conserved hypothetical protein [Neospora caninum Liverpool]